MAVKRTKVDLSIERQILTGMVVSDRFLQDIVPMFNPDLFEIEYAPIIAKWCIRHFERYQTAPGILIRDIFDAWARSNPNSEQTKFIDGFLGNLSDEFEHAPKFNAEYLMDKAITYLKARSLKVMAEDINYCLDHNDLETAEKVYLDYNKIEKITAGGIDVLDDETAWRDAFADNSEVLFSIPGKLGQMLNEELRRDTFISLMGVAKIGKTWNLNFLAHQAVKAKCNVAMFQAGDLSQGQMMVRNGIYITQRSNKAKYCGELRIPILDCAWNQNDSCEHPKRASKCGCFDSDGVIMDVKDAVGYKPCIECQGKKGNFKGAVWHEIRRPVRPLTWQEAYKAAQEYKARFKTKRFKLVTHASKTLTVSGIRRQLDVWERLEGWIPDVILVDYADILAPEHHTKEERDGINEIWMNLRGLSQLKHCCVITATQANGMAIKEKSVGREHYAGDRRKYDHVTAMFALSQTPEEKRKGITRWGAIVIREDDWDEEHHVNVLGCISIGRPFLDSY